MFSVAIATVLFPTMSRLAARGDLDGFRATIGRGMRLIIFTLLPAAAFSIVLATPIIRILYQRGQWTPAQTPGTAACLAAFSVGLVFNGAMLMLNRAFFSLQSNWIPTMVALGNLFLNALLDYLFYPLGAWGIPLSTALVNIAGTAALVFFFRREIGDLGGWKTVFSVARILVASAIAGAVAYALWEPLDAALGRTFIAQAVTLGVGLAAGAAIYIASCRLLRVRELDQLRSLRGAH
jgi:putative peptidoglycan lipid II flippase